MKKKRQAIKFMLLLCLFMIGTFATAITTFAYTQPTTAKYPKPGTYSTTAEFGDNTVGGGTLYKKNSNGEKYYTYWEFMPNKSTDLVTENYSIYTDYRQNQRIDTHIFSAGKLPIIDIRADAGKPGYAYVTKKFIKSHFIYLSNRGSWAVTGRNTTMTEQFTVNGKKDRAVIAARFLVSPGTNYYFGLKDENRDYDICVAMLQYDKDGKLIEPGEATENHFWGTGENMSNGFRTFSNAYYAILYVKYAGRGASVDPGSDGDVELTVNKHFKEGFYITCRTNQFDVNANGGKFKNGSTKKTKEFYNLKYVNVNDVNPASINNTARYSSYIVNATDANKKTTANWCTDRTNKVINPCQNITAARKTNIIRGLYSNWNKDVFVIDRNHITFKKSSTLPIEVPKRTGYVFAGFYTDKTGGTKIVNANGKIIVSKAIKEGSETGTTVQLYAQWIPYKLTLTYNINGGKFDTTPFQTVDSKGNPRYYYKLNGTGATVGYDTVKTTKPANEYATKYAYDVDKINLVDVKSFGLSKAGYHIDASKAYKYGSATSTTLWPQTESTNSTILTTIKNATANGNASKVLYVNWIPNTYQIHYNVNAPEDMLYGWSEEDKADEEKLNAEFGSMSNTVITYGNASTRKLSSCGYDVDGYKFVGWKIDNTIYPSNNLKLANDLTTSNNVIFQAYAQWVISDDKYNISFDGNKPDDTLAEVQSVPESIQYKRGDSIPTVGIPTLEGYKFTGWYIDIVDNAQIFADKNGNVLPSISVIAENGRNIIYTDSDNKMQKKGDFTLYAKWEPITYDIIFDGNEGTVNIEGNPYTTHVQGNVNPINDIKYDDEFEIPLNNEEGNMFIRQGYKLMGYSKDKDAHIPSYSLGEYYKNLTSEDNGQVTLYAIWEPIQYILSFNPNNTTITPRNINNMDYTTEPTGSINDIEVKYDEDIKMPNGYEREGYILVGFSTNPKALSENTDDIYITGNSQKNFSDIDNDVITLYALWKPISYKIKFNKNDSVVTPNNISNNPYTTEPTGEISDIEIEYDNIFIMPKGFERIGYTYIGYDRNHNATTPEYKINETYTNLSSTNGMTVMLYAIYNPISYTVQYDMNLASTPQYPDVTIEFDEELKLEKTPERNGYVFKGWQIISGANHGNYKNITDTDPFTSGATTYAAESNIKNIRNTPGIVVLCAIWGHDYILTDDFVAWDGIGMDDSSPFIYHNNKANIEISNDLKSEDCYYVNTNVSNDWAFDRTAALVSGLPDYIIITSYGSSEYSSVSKTLTEITSKDNIEVIKSTSGDINVTENNYKLIKNWVVIKDKWYDKYKDSESGDTLKVYDTKGYTAVIGDNIKPEISGIDSIDKIVGIDKSQYDKYLVDIYSTDNGSGLSDSTSYIDIRNTDNKVYAKLPLKNDNTLNSANIYNILRWQQFDLIETDKLAQNIFNGKYSITYTICDNVGNVLTNNTTSGVFDLSAEIYDRDNQILNYPILKGDMFKIKVKTFGYADALQLCFPEEWYINDKFPLYVYWGDIDNYDETKLEKITKNYMYIKTDSDATGKWEQEFIFISPLNAQSGPSNINIKAMKGKISLINISHIEINDRNDLKIKELSRKLNITIDNKSILSKLREHIISIM